jgi:hypothetical protein
LIYRKEVQDKQTKSKEDAKLLPKRKLTVEEDAVEYLKKLNKGREIEPENYVARQADKPLKNLSLREEKNSGEWLYF